MKMTAANSVRRNERLFAEFFGRGRGGVTNVFDSEEALPLLKILLGTSFLPPGVNLLIGKPRTGKTVGATYLAANLALWSHKVTYIDCSNADLVDSTPAQLIRAQAEHNPSSHGLTTPNINLIHSDPGEALKLATLGAVEAHSKLIIVDLPSFVTTSNAEHTAIARDLGHLSEICKSFKTSVLVLCTPDKLESPITGARLETEAKTLLYTAPTRVVGGSVEAEETVFTIHNFAGTQKVRYCLNSSTGVLGFYEPPS
jgi:hypothetical protein